MTKPSGSTVRISTVAVAPVSPAVTIAPGRIVSGRGARSTKPVVAVVVLVVEVGGEGALVGVSGELGEFVEEGVEEV